MIKSFCFLILLTTSFRDSAASSIKRMVSEGGKALENAGSTFLTNSFFKAFLTKTMGLEDYKEYSCNIHITNYMNAHQLVVPRVFLLRGFSKVPPPLRIESGGKEGISKSTVFVTDDLFMKDFASHGILSYEIRKNQAFKAVAFLHISWKIMKGATGTTDIKNYFYIELEPNVLSSIVTAPHWDADLNKQLTDNEEKFYKATLEGKYRQVEFGNGILVRAHMSSGNNAQLMVSVEETGNMYALTKRDFGLSLAIGGASTLLSVLTNKLFNFLSQTRSASLTLQNESSDLTLENPIWHLLGVQIQDSVPWQIVPRDANQITLTVPFASGETMKEKISSSVFVLSFKVRDSNKRIVFLIKWPKRISTDKFNLYSVFSMHDDYDEKVEGKLKIIADTISSSSDEDSADTELKKNGFTMENLSQANRKLVPYIPAENFQEYLAWKFPLTGRMNNKGLRLATVMGSDKKATSLMVNLNSVPDQYDMLYHYNPKPYVEV